MLRLNVVGTVSILTQDGVQAVPSRVDLLVTSGCALVACDLRSQEVAIMVGRGSLEKVRPT